MSEQLKFDIDPSASREVEGGETLSVATSGEIDPPSIATYESGGRQYPLCIESRCAICKRSDRFEIERLSLMNAATYAQLSERYGMSTKSIYTHMKKHVPVARAVLQQHLDDRVQEQGQVLSEYSKSYLDHIGFSKVVMERGFQRIMTGEVDVDINEALKAASILQKASEIDTGAADVLMWQQTYLELLMAIKEVVSPQQLEQVFVKAGPAIRSLWKKTEDKGQAELKPMGA
jgi:hypothetical protein